MSYIKKIKCLIQQVNNLLLYKPKLEYNLDNNILTSTYINGQQASTEIPLSIEGGRNLITANTDSSTASNGSNAVQLNAEQISAYDQHLVFEEHQNGGGDLISVLKLSDAFLSTLLTEVNIGQLNSYFSISEATSDLGVNKLFRYKEENLDGVPSPNNSIIGITKN